MANSRIFSSYRALGYVSNHVPLVVRYIQRRREYLIVTVVGKSFLTYSSSQLRLLSASTPEAGEITCITAGAHQIFLGRGNVIQSWTRGTELEYTYVGHEKPIHLLLPFGSHFISVDVDSNLKLWDIKTEDVALELTFNNETFRITAAVHPPTYVNKVLLGSHQGAMQLWNLKSSKLIYTFGGWKSAITVLQEAPAVDVIAVGLDDGRIMIHNLKYDELIMKFKQDWGRVTSLSFRTDGHPILASGSTQGHIAIWNLEEKRLETQMKHVHSGAVVGMQFLSNEPIMVTNSVDNSLKMWIFDLADGGGRLLRFREGHSAPPTRIKFYGSNGENILSSGEDSSMRNFSTVLDHLHRTFGGDLFREKAAKKKGGERSHRKKPAIMDFAFEVTREKDWDNIAACHRNLRWVSLWSYARKSASKMILRHTEIRHSNTIIHNIQPTCVTLTSCGNFALVGFETGHVDKFNIQSGLFRGGFGEKAHAGAVVGIVTDELNRVVVTIGMDKLIQFWRFKSQKLWHMIKVDTVIHRCRLHRESGLLAMASDDYTLQLLDIDTKRIVRKFEGHTSQITDFDFSSDSRWLVSASNDCTIRTWDIPAGRLIDCFMVENICCSLALSPKNDYLATVHVDNLGVYLWVNQTLYMHVSLQPLPDDFEPQMLALPEVESVTSAAESSKDELGVEDLVFKSPNQIANELVTLSLLPDSRWKNLLELDLIRNRNKPKEPPKAPKTAPFFLPTVTGLELTFNLPSETPNKKAESRILSSKTFESRTTFSQKLEAAQTRTEFVESMEILKQLGASAIEVELHSLAPEGGGSSTLLLNFLKMIDEVLQSNRDFEAAQAYLGLFLKLHGTTVASDQELRKFARTLLTNQSFTWDRIQTMFNRCQCIVSYLKSAAI